MMTDYLYGYDSDHAKVDTIAKGSIEGYPYIIRKWKYTSFMPPYDVRLFHGINKHHDIPFNESLHDALLAAHEAVDDLKAKEKAIIELTLVYEAVYLLKIGKFKEVW